MIQAGRGRDNRFSANHRLFRRCKKDEVIGDHLTGASISYDNMSTNWSKYSKPWDVIFDFPNYGIARLRVGDLPDNLPVAQPPGTPVAPHAFRPQHVPYPENYSHTEIWVYKADERLKRVSSATVKKEFRQIISDRSFVILFPGV